MKRVVSLIASSTEIVCALGLEGQLVGRSHECDYPPSVSALPVLTEPKLNPDAASGEIDRQVKAVVQDALSVYRVRAEELERLRPDVIVTQTQCEVCAVSLKDVEEAVCRFTGGLRPQVVPLEPNGLDDVWEDIRRVARALDAQERGERLIGDLKRRMEEVADRASSLPARPTVACIEWIDPLMAAGNWMPQLVEMAGGVNLFGKADAHAPWMTWEELRAADPDVIVALPCGFDIERTRREMPALTEKAGWESLRAVQAGRVYLTDGNQYFNRPGPRLAESLEILAEILHPETFRFGHEGTGWVPA
ncbi:MAG: cobalamin-binding protein [Nitrospinota bacterium]